MSSLPTELPEGDIGVRSTLPAVETDVPLTPDHNALASHLQASIEAERSQLVRELHDDMGGLVVGALMDVAWVEAHLGQSPDVQAKLQRVRQSLRAAIDLKRKLIEEMRPTLLDNVGLFAALKWHFARLCDLSNVASVATFALPEPILKPEAAISVFRTVQEALRLLTTSLHATSISLDAKAQDKTLCLQLLHDGRAMNHPHVANLPEFESMAHRIARLQGSLTIEPATGGMVAWYIGIPIGRPD
jgi:signal transduction histidine kinase